jgi:hypothetical protein
MPNFAEPNADGAHTAWSKSSGTAAWSLLDDGLRFPDDDPRTSGDGGFIFTQTDEALQSVAFPNLTFDAAQSVGIWVYGSGGNKREVTAAYSNDNGSTWQTEASLFVANEAANWNPLTVQPIHVDSQAELDGLQVRFRCNTTAGGGGQSNVQIDAIYVIQVVNRRGRLTWAELEVPDLALDRRGRLTWAEAEFPSAPRRGVVTWGEFEVPVAPRRGQVTWAELEMPGGEAEPFECPDDDVARYQQCVEEKGGWRTQLRITRSFNPVTGYS